MFAKSAIFGGGDSVIKREYLLFMYAIYENSSVCYNKCKYFLKYHSKNEYKKYSINWKCRGSYS